jgi:AAA15 family ATPase/GTPase
MKYIAFEIKSYRAIEKTLKIDFSKSTLIPIVGINECGKTTILQAIYCFDSINDEEYNGKHLNDTKNLYKTSDDFPPIISAYIEVKYSELNQLYKDFIKEEEKDKEVEQTNDENSPSPKLPHEIPFDKKNFQGTIKIDRDLTTKKYFI